jgi:hypothetical protein
MVRSFTVLALFLLILFASSQLAKANVVCSPSATDTECDSPVKYIVEDSGYPTRVPPDSVVSPLGALAYSVSWLLEQTRHSLDWRASSVDLSNATEDGTFTPSSLQRRWPRVDLESP